MVDGLDARRTWVYTGSMIVEVTTTKAPQLGIQWVMSIGDPNMYDGGSTNFGTGSSSLLTLAGTIVTITAGDIGSVTA